MGATHIDRGRPVIMIRLRPQGHISVATRLGIELSAWCKEQGLVRDHDYDWAFNHGELHFRFYGDSESYATLFTLRWAEHL